jgi:hypothetical protein
MARNVHGVKSKMNNGRKKDAKKVVRRAVRRAGKAQAKLSGERLELAAKYLAAGNLCTLDQAINPNRIGFTRERANYPKLLPDLTTLKSVVERAIDIAIEGAMEEMSMDGNGGTRNMDRFETKATNMVEKEIKSFRADLNAGGKRAAYYIETLQKEIPIIFSPSLGPCKWFHYCKNEAVTTVKHSQLGDVPCCQRCANFAKNTPRQLTPEELKTQSVDSILESWRKL